MSNVTSGYTFSSSTDPITAAKLNLLGNPTVAVANGEITALKGSPSGIGYADGAGGAVTQATNKSTSVTLDRVCGYIVTSNATLNATTAVGFTFNNALIGADDNIFFSIRSGATANSYTVQADAVAAGSCHVAIYNHSGSNLSEALYLVFTVIKGAII